MKNKNYLKIIANKLLDLVFNFYALCISLEIKYRKSKKNTYLYYFGYFGWADNFCFYLSQYRKIKINNNFALVWNNQNYEICKFLFPNSKIIKLFFSIPKFIPNEKIEKFLINKKNFCPRVLKSKLQKKDFLDKNRDSYRKLLKYFLRLKSKRNLISQNNKNYVCFYFRYFQKNVKILRSSSNIQKCYSIINFLLEKNLNIVLLGNKTEKYLQLIKTRFHKEIKEKKILFASKMIRDSSFSDQLCLMENSEFFCGTQSGFLAMYYYLKKNAISFDGFNITEHTQINQKNIKFLYKKIFEKDQSYDLKYSEIKDNFDFNTLVENSAEEIITNIESFL